MADIKQKVELLPTEDETLSMEKKPKWYHINKNTITSKIAYFIMGSKEGAYKPFLYPFLVDIGLSASQAGLISGLRLIGGLIGSVVFGMIADYSQKFKMVLMFVCIGAMGTMMPQPWIPNILSNKINCIENKTISSNSTTTKMNCGQTEGSPALFWTSFAFYFLMSFFDGYIWTFVDTVVMSQIAKSKRKINIGQQRVFAPIGFGISTLIVSALLKSIPKDLHISQYAISHFYYSLVLVFLMINSHFIVKGVKVQKKPDRKGVTMMSQIWVTVMRPRVLFFLSTVFVHGFSIGCHVSFLFTLMKTFSPPDILFGITSCVASASALIFYTSASKIIKKLGGPLPTMGFALFFSIVRYGTYGFTPYVYLLTVVQIIMGMAVSVFNVAMMLNTEAIAPEEIRSSMFGITNAVLFGVAGVTSNVVGGIVTEAYGIKVLFQGVAFLCAIWTVLIFFHVLYDRRRAGNGGNTMSQEDTKMIPVVDTDSKDINTSQNGHNLKENDDLHRLKV